MTTPIDDFDDFVVLDPFFRIIEEVLAGFVDGRHFFDLLAEDVIFDYVISVPGYPRRVDGRRAVAELYRSYGKHIILRSADKLAVQSLLPPSDSAARPGRLFAVAVADAPRRQHDRSP